jgi:lipopolysaccharide/colanic/teichoic acid biosynthesis glycosyltransferase
VLRGCGATARRLYTPLPTPPALGLRPLGFVQTPSDGEVSQALLPGPLLGGIEDFKQLSGETEVAILTSRDQLALRGLIVESLPPANLILVSEVQDIQTLWLRVRPLGNVIGIQFERDPYLTQNRALKRAIDLLVAVPAAIVALPVIAVLATAVWLIDRRSPFYVQERVGGCGRIIRIPKLRSMYADADSRLEEYLDRNPRARDEWERYYKLTDDPRILPVLGKALRRASLDELPQLWSIIKGEMSLVGPRPFPVYHTSKFDPEFQHIRTIVPPGLTGLWQVTARSNGDLDVQRAQDLFYILNWSIWLDLYILLQTLPAIITAKGAK